MSCPEACGGGEEGGEGNLKEKEDQEGQEGLLFT